MVAKKEIPDIITFVEDKEWLNISVDSFILYLLKGFYRGSESNENLELTEREIELYKNNKEGFLGRYKDKHFVCSIIALYEAMRTLEYKYN